MQFFSVFIDFNTWCHVIENTKTTLNCGFFLCVKMVRIFHIYMKLLKASLTLQETPSIHDSMNIPKIEIIS